jgi:hypothetical protein
MKTAKPDIRIFSDAGELARAAAVLSAQRIFSRTRCETPFVIVVANQAYIPLAAQRKYIFDKINL